MFTSKNLVRRVLATVLAAGAGLSIGQMPASAVTGTLELYRFDCIQETDESGSDSPYFLVFTASGTNPDTDNLVMVRQSSWDNEVDTGNIFRPRATIATTTPITASSLVLAAVVEEDGDPDLSAAELSSLRNQMHNAYQIQFWRPAAERVANMRAEFATAINHFLDDGPGGDDYLGNAQVPMNGSTIPSVDVAGDGGRYRMHFLTR